MPKRITYFDWLRGLATIAVVILHMFNKILTDHSVAELGIPLVLSWTELQIALTRWAVPVFLMITGALLLNPNKETPWRKIFGYVGRMVAVLAIFCPVYACMSAKTISLGAICNGFVNMVTQSSWDHLWYLYALIGLYLLTPIFASYVRGTSRDVQRTTLMVLGVTALVIPTINAGFGANITSIAWLGAPAFYYLLGTYAHRYLQLDHRICVVCIVSIVVCLAAAAWCVCALSWYPKWLTSPNNPLIAAWSLLIFLAAKELVEGKEPPRPLALTSDLSLAIYLVHPLPLIVLYLRLYWMPYKTLPPVVFELCVLAIVFGITLPVAALLKKLPVLRKVL